MLLVVLALLVIVVLATRAAVTRRQTEPQTPSPAWTPNLRRVAIIAGVVGMGLRLVGFDSSLSLDEFGTLWAVEDGLGVLIERTTFLHGQSPFYYFISWISINLLGESEIALRLPSLLAIIGATFLIYRIGELLHGPRAGVLAASVFWLNLWCMYLSTAARPYGLGLLFAAIALFGFVRATIDGRAASRVWFILGVVGLIASHCLLALMLLGVGIAYLVTPSLRERYPLLRFSFDIGMMATLSAPLVPQILKLWTRRGEFSWIVEISYQPVAQLIGSETILLAAGLAAGAFWRSRSKRLGTLTVLGLSGYVPPLLIVLLSRFGVNLLHPRYLLAALAPVCLLAGIALALAPVRTARAAWVTWAFLNGLFVVTIFSQVGTFTGIGAQDWRGGTAALEQRLAVDLGAPVLFRSGFSGDDLLPLGREVTGASLAPLRSPGQPPFRWQVIPLTFSWDGQRRAEYFERVIPPALESHEVFYYYSDIGDGAYYGTRVEEWVTSRFEGRFKVEWIDVGQGLVAGRFSTTRNSPEVGDSN